MSETAETPIDLTGLHPIGRGVERPEHVVVARDGRVFASDKGSAIAELIDENTIRRISQAGGEPNGFALDRDGHVLIANWGVGALQELDPVTGAIATLLADQLEGRPLKWLNFVLLDSLGALWFSVSTTADDLLDTIARGTPDGHLFRVAPDRRSAHVVVDAVGFPNCMALDRDEAYLYVVRTLTADVVRFPIHGETLGPQERFGPPLGDRRPDEFGPDAGRFLADPHAGGGWPTAARSMPRETSGSHSFWRTGSSRSARTARRPSCSTTPTARHCTARPASPGADMTCATSTSARS
jgi:gluconolactonase